MELEKPYIAVEDCTDLAYKSIKQSGAHVSDEDVETLAENIKRTIDDWFGDMKHLKPSYRPEWNIHRQ